MSKSNTHTGENTKFKDILIRVVEGDETALEDLIKQKQNWKTHENKIGRKNTYLDVRTVYTVPTLNHFYKYCIENFAKLGKDEVKTIFQEALMEFVNVEILQKNPTKPKELGNYTLVKWAKKYIHGFIQTEQDRVLGKVVLAKNTGEIVSREIEIVSERGSSSDYDNDEDNLSDSSSYYNQKSFEQWDQKNLFMSFADFIKDMEMEAYINKILTKQQLAVYQKLIRKYELDNQKTYGNTHIAKELNIDESRVRAIEETIGDKLYKLYKLWFNTKKKKNVPLSHEIRDFLTMFNNVIDNIEDVNAQFELLIGWFKTQFDKEKQVNVNYLHKNRVEHEPSIIDLIMEGDSQFKEVLLQMDKQLHKSTYMTLCKIMNGEIVHRKLRTETKNTIITKCLSIFYTYLNNLDKDLRKVASYIKTYEKQ
ncbi:hypothetical protein [Evansella tamaricis]|uniref:Sigma-70 family RNA polymerase sigma factor n=1 Tax=Evansella tamaricis TaxID=2069301 RepID=A0ABS6JLA5_9BACI|nr:hypothetical protein [Evansella tamaricis]MBU9714449.1 hypothetical protein [Evansella tamaricis]